jgi:hypothetical protein
MEMRTSIVRSTRLVAALAIITACGERAVTVLAPSSSPSLAQSGNKPAKAGSIAVSVSTSGSDWDKDGYTVKVDGGSATTVGVSGSANFSNVGTGSHSVSLEGLAANCTAAANPQTVSVANGRTSQVQFAVNCSAITQTGSLTVTASTSGSNPDSDGYSVVVDGGQSTSLASNGSASFTGLQAGSHTVTLSTSSIAANCTLSSTNPQTVSVAAGGTATATFNVTCTAIPTTGTITVKTSTTGANFDPDGYTIALDGNSSSAKSVGVSDSASFSGVSEGSHSVTLAGLASNCSTTNNPRTVSVTAGGTTQAAFAIVCAAVTTPAYTFAGAGDVASCAWEGDSLTAEVLDRIVASDPNTTIFNAGDIAYDASTASELANCYDPNWGRHKARTYVALGNHEYKVDPNPTWDYFGDRAGPRGLGYYSYDLGAWHVIMLNDNIPFGVGSAQDTWLKQDLANSGKSCTIAVFHQPLFVSGALEITPSRKPIWDRLYAAGVEIVLNGHLHWYERFAPQRPDGTVDTVNGIREFVVGTGGNTIAIGMPTAANLEKQGNTRGVLKFTLTPGNYSWEFVTIAGKTFTDSGSGTCH